MPVSATARRRAGRPADVPPEAYPFSDGKVLMETDPHANAIIAMRDQLQWHFEDRPDVYVAGSMAVYYRRGDPRAVVAPDVFVVLGAAKRSRRSYRMWDEGGVAPAFVVEVASPSTSRLDATGKRATYERMGVTEYWRFDPLGEQIAEGLTGWRMAGGRYERLRAEAAGCHRSAVLGLEMRVEGWLLRFRDPLLGLDMLTYSETSRGKQEAERERDEAERKAQVAERERDEAERRAQVAERERDEANRRIRELEARLR